MVFTIGIAASLALLLGLSGLQKIRRFDAFRSVLAQYEVFPSALSTPAAALVVAAELVVPVLCFMSVVAALGLAAALLSGYAIGIAINLLRGRTHIDCGCSVTAQTDQRIHWAMVWRNAVLVCGALLGMALLDHSSLAPSGHWLEMVSLVASVGVLAMLYVSFDHALRFSARKNGA